MNNAIADRKPVPINHLFGGGSHYSGRLIWELIQGTDSIVVKYRGLNVFHYTFATALWVILGCVAFYFSETKGEKILLVPSALFSIMALVMPVGMYFFNKENVSRGDWLIYNIKDDLITLPRLSIQFKKEQLYMLQMIVGIPGAESLSMTEVNIMLDEKHDYQRYPLLNVDSPNMVCKLVNKLSELLSVDNQRVDYYFTGSVEVTIRNYRNLVISYNLNPTLR